MPITVQPLSPLLIAGDQGLERARDDLGSEPRVGREHAVEANEMEPWPWDKRGQALHELQRRHDDVGRAISIGCLQWEIPQTH